MGEIRRYMLKNGIWIAFGLILTVISVILAYDKRGYLAYGGEWLTLPLVLMALNMARNIGRIVRYLFGLEDDYGADGD